MSLYSKLSSIVFLKQSYSAKMLALCFVGIHVPLVAFVVYFPFQEGQLNKLSVFLLLLVFTLLATSLTLLAMNKLLRPLKDVNQSIRSYLDNGKMSALPEQYSDEVGELMRSTNFLIRSVEQLSRDKNLLTSLLSHDLRSPTTAIISIVDVIDLIPEKDQKLALIPEINTLAQQQLDLIDGYLQQINRTEKTINLYQSESFPIRTLLDDLLFSVERLLEQKGVRLRIVPSETIVLYSVPFLVRRILLNLLYNAIKFSHPGQEIHMECRMSNEGEALIMIRDSGIGFEPGIAEELFIKNTPHKRKGTSGEPSTGIGLYLCREIARSLKGNLKAESPGNAQGALFTLSIPIT